MTQPPLVSLVVLNWNGRAFLDDCLSSLERLDHPHDRLELILCDNGSTDGSVEHVGDAHPRFKVIKLGHNRGFAEGNNRAAAQAMGEWVGFLNNDMEVPTDWLSAMLRPPAARPGLACVASRIVSWDGGLIDFIGGGINFQGHGLQVDHGAASSAHDVERPVLFACGGAMLIRRQLFLEVGGFDPGYFAYFEDVDLGWRLNLLGHDIWYTPAATVRHRHHGTASRLPPYQLKVLSERNALYTIYKNYDAERLAAVLPVALGLLNEKALRMLQFDRDLFGIPGASPPPPTPHSGGAAPARPGAMARIRQRGLVGALKAASLRLRHAVDGLLARPPAVPPVSATGAEIPLMALSQLVTISEFVHNMERLREQREWVQSRRRRTDHEVLGLGGVLLEDPTFGDSEYLDFQHWLSRVAGVDELFQEVAR
ncbi:MAG: glycosyltransferase family 2 protein [Candidatus Dormibacteria bacterium]